MRAVVMAMMMTAAATISARAQSVQVDHVDIVGKGLYTVTTGDKTANASVPSGSIAAVTIATNTQSTTTIQGKVGLEFGLQYVVAGAPNGADVPLDIVITYPPAGLADPSSP